MTRFLLIILSSILVVARVIAADWPDGYVVHEDSESPDGRYGILIPDNEHENDDNFFVNLKTHQKLGKIEGTDYYQGQNHFGLNVTWAQNSQVAMADYEGRFGFDSIYVLEPKSKGFTQTDIGGHIQSAIDTVIKNQSRDSEARADAIVVLRFDSSGKKIRVYANGTTNPKEYENTQTYRAIFLGTFDVPARKWISSGARPLNEKEQQSLESVFQTESVEKFVVNPDAFAGLNPDAIEPQFYHDQICFRSEESRFKNVDDRMNDVYQGARLLLSPAEFTKLKNNQIEWLKKRDAIASMSEKSKLTAKRIAELQERAW
jgi:hypothetical protein